MSGTSIEPVSEAILKRIKGLEEENTDLKHRLESMEEIRLRLGELSERLTVVHRLCQRLNTFDISRITRIVTQEIPELIGAKYCSLYLYDYANNDLVLQGHNHPEDITSRISVKQTPTTIMEIALSKKDTIYATDIDEFEKEYQNFKIQRRFKSKYETKSFVSSPLVIGGEKSRYVVGVINFADKIDKGFFDVVNDIATIRQISQFLALAIKNCKLFNEVQQQARQDSLTRLWNYRGFHETLISEINRAVRYSRPLSILMFDIDNFKQVNDTFGHQAGDYVLVEIGKIVRRILRREDLPARYGGDEIVAILPETAKQGALALVTRLKDIITGHEFVYNGQKLDVKISCGLCEYKPSQSISEFVTAVDHALYEAKQRGKNTIVVVE